jgi:ABC-type transport system substrate-binding protein
VPEGYEFYWQPPVTPTDPVHAKKLLAEAGFPNGFDAGDYNCGSSYANIGEAVLDNLLRVGIRMKLRPLERAAYIQAGPAPFGNPLRDLCDQGRHVLLRRLSGCRHVIPTAGRRGGPRQARGDPAQNAAAGP